MCPSPKPVWSIMGNRRMAELPNERILGYSVTNALKDYCIRQVLQWLESSKTKKYLACANPHSLMVARKDQTFKEALQNADLLVPDGIGMVIASIILGGQIRERVTGSDMFLGLNGVLNEKGGCRVFLLGSTDRTLAKIEEKMRAEFPNITLVGTYSPPFRSVFNDEDNTVMIEAVNRAKPDVLWVGLTAPKQEKWIYENKNRLNAKFIGAIGAVFDFYAGNAKRSSSLFQNMGLEWLPRLLRNPRRLWRRTLVSMPSFLFIVIYHRIKSAFHP